MTYNASERKQVRAAEKAARLVELQSDEVITSIMSSTNGRAWLLALLKRCHIFAASASTNPYMTYFAEGERNIGAQLCNDIVRICPDQYILMMRESNERDAANRADADRRDQGSVEGDRDEEGNAAFDGTNFDHEGNWIGEGQDPRYPG